MILMGKGTGLGLCVSMVTDGNKTCELCVGFHDNGVCVDNKHDDDDGSDNNDVGDNDGDDDDVGDDNGDDDDVGDDNGNDKNDGDDIDEMHTFLLLQ